MNTRDTLTRHAIQLYPVTFNIFRITKRPTDFRVPFAATERLIIGASLTSIGRKLKENGPACLSRSTIFASSTRKIFSFFFDFFS